MSSIQGKAPELVGIVDWINSPPLTLEQLKGKVVLIDFWTYSCINCLRTLPYLEKWDASYRDKGLVIIGVHTPEFQFEKEIANVKRAAKDLKVDYPIAIDNDYATWNAYHNQYWPAHYLIDQAGNIRMVHTGEGGYVETENAIRSLLGLPPLMMKESAASISPITSESYLGFERADRYAVALVPGLAMHYSYKPPLADDHIGLRGEFKAEAEYIEATSDGATIDLNYLAKQVYLVLAGQSSQPVRVSLDGKEVREFKVDGAEKYDIITSASYGRHLVSIQLPKGVKAYVFTFGNE